jgi:hypothetical protein
LESEEDPESFDRFPISLTIASIKAHHHEHQRPPKETVTVAGNPDAVIRHRLGGKDSYQKLRKVFSMGLHLQQAGRPRQYAQKKRENDMGCKGDNCRIRVTDVNDKNCNEARAFRIDSKKYVSIQWASKTDSEIVESDHFHCPAG